MYIQFSEEPHNYTKNALEKIAMKEVLAGQQNEISFNKKQLWLNELQEKNNNQANLLRTGRQTLQPVCM